MSKGTFKKLTQLNHVYAIPTKKRKNDDGTETQLYKFVKKPQY